jgi:cytoskeleton protein RodZ
MSELQSTSSGSLPTIDSKHLSALRESKGLTVSDISQRTRLSAKQVDLLESGQYSALPGSAFVMGALRSYCKVVGIEPESYLEQAKATFAASQDQDLPTPDRLHTSLPSRAAGGLENSSSRLWWVASGLLGVIAIGLYFANPNGIAGLIKKDTKVTAAPTSSATVVDISPVATQAAQSSASNPTTSVAPSTLPADPAMTVSKPVATEQPSGSLAPPSTVGLNTEVSSASPTVASNATSALPTAAPTGVALPASSSKSIELNFARDAWVEVKDNNGKSLVNRLFKAGIKENIEVAGPVSVIVGSASGVSLNWSGSPMDLKPFTKDDVARFTLK